MIPDDKLKAWRALCEAATPGPWTDEGLGIVDVVVSGRKVQVALAAGQAAMYDERDATSGIQRANANFIAEAREAVPALLDEVERLRGHELAHEMESRLADKAIAERDRLAAENERLRAFAVTISDEQLDEISSKLIDARTAVAVAAARRAEAENDRLRAEVERMRPVVEAAKEIAFVVRDHGAGRASFMLNSFAEIIARLEAPAARADEKEGDRG